jgi:hypothetical protein
MTTPWKCARCAVTATRMPGHECPGAPANWTEQNGEAFCLSCRRALAGEARLVGVPLDTTTARRAQLRRMAVIDFELERDPSRSNGEIARAIRTSVVAVGKARQRVAGS